MNQGVEVVLYDESTGVNDGAALVAGRQGLMSLGWRVAPDFVPRTLVGVVALKAPNGAIRYISRAGMITGNSGSVPLPIDQALQIDGSQVVAGTQIAVAFLEADPATGAGEPPPGSRLPARTGEFAPLPVDSWGTAMEVFLVPLRHERAGCVSHAPQGRDVEELVANQLRNIYPLHSINVSTAPEIAFTENVDPDLSNVLSFVTAQRAASPLLDTVFVYGLIDPCGDDVCSGTLGLAYEITDDTGSALPTGFGPWRTGVGRACLDNVPAALRTLTHEIGHNLGRRHVGCNGLEIDVDPSYPHPRGQTGSWGFDAMANTLHPPNTNEYMGYCRGLTWISDYGWNRVHDVLLSMSRPVASFGSVDLDLGLLIHFNEDGGGGSRWLGGVPFSGGQPTVVEYRAGGRVEVVAAVRVTLGDSEVGMVLARAPTRLLDADQVVWRNPETGQQFTIGVPAR